MITFPNAKINLGLNVTERRADGYHNLETIFYPVKINDALEFTVAENKTTLTIIGKDISGDMESNLTVRALRLLQKDFELPELNIYLKKNIHIGAGLGGGSADAAFMLNMLNEEFTLNISEERLEEYASCLGADCPFFIRNKPVFATGIGDVFSPIDINLKGYEIYLIKPDVFISTAEAYSGVSPRLWTIPLREALSYPMDKWKELLFNDFEKSVFEKHTELKEIKNELYRAGAIYAAMSGSGSTIYGIFAPKTAPKAFPTLKGAESFLLELE